MAELNDAKLFLALECNFGIKSKALFPSSLYADAEELCREGATMSQLRSVAMSFMWLKESKSFRWFLLSTFSSALGRNAYAVASSWILVASGKGSAAVAVFFAIISVTELITSPAAGWLSDRFDRRLVFMIADLTRLLTAAVLGLALVDRGGQWTIWFSAIVFATCDRVALTASQSMIPAVGRGLSPGAANSISFFAMQLGGLVSAALVGVVLHVSSGSMALATVALAFAVSVIGMFLMQDREVSVHPQIRTAHYELKANAHLLYISGVYALLYVGGMLVSILGPSLVYEEFSGTALDFGKLESAWSVGSIIGALLLIPLAHLAHRRVLITAILVLMAAFFAVLKLASLSGALLLFAILGALYNLGRVAVEVRLQATVAKSVLGRAKAILHCSGVALSLALFGVVAVTADQLAPSTTFLLFAGVLIVATIALSMVNPASQNIA